MPEFRGSEIPQFTNVHRLCRRRQQSIVEEHHALTPPHHPPPSLSPLFSRLAGPHPRHQRAVQRRHAPGQDEPRRGEYARRRSIHADCFPCQSIKNIFSKSLEKVVYVPRAAHHASHDNQPRAIHHTRPRRKRRINPSQCLILSLSSLQSIFIHFF